MWGGDWLLQAVPCLKCPPLLLLLLGHPVPLWRDSFFLWWRERLLLLRQHFSERWFLCGKSRTAASVSLVLGTSSCLCCSPRSNLNPQASSELRSRRTPACWAPPQTPPHWVHLCHPASRQPDRGLICFPFHGDLRCPEECDLGVALGSTPPEAPEDCAGPPQGPESLSRDRVTWSRTSRAVRGVSGSTAHRVFAYLA